MLEGGGKRANSCLAPTMYYNKAETATFHFTGPSTPSEARGPAAAAQSHGSTLETHNFRLHPRLGGAESAF